MLKFCIRNYEKGKSVYKKINEGKNLIRKKTKDDPFGRGARHIKNNLREILYEK
jgi:hypothetical protein